jgi:ribosomal protein L7/L12
MKKTLILLAILIAIATITYTVVNKKTSLNANAEISIADTSAVAKIFLTDMQGNKIIVVKNKTEWILNDTLIARKDAVDGILSTMRKISAVQPVPESAHNNIVKQLSAQGIKVEIFDAENEVLSSFTIGGTGQQGQGNYMYKKGAERPYIYEKKGFVGDLSAAFYTNQEEWRSREIYKYNPANIQKVSVFYAQNRDSSFTITQSKSGFTMGYDNGTVVDFSNTKIVDYLKEFKSKHCLSYENKIPTRDSIIHRSQPYGHIAVQEANKAMDTLHLVFFKANQKAGSIREIDGQLFDQEFLFAYTNKDLMVLPTSTFSKLLARPGYFAK